MTTLSNQYLTASIADHGAELHSLIANDVEYIWQADPKYWARHAPILFPIVGKVYNGEYRVNGNTYNLPQHGFARDRDFRLVSADATEATFLLQGSEDTLTIYPYRFQLMVRYQLTGRQLHISYIVRNMDDVDICFQLGAHPAFNWQLGTGCFQLTKDGKPLQELVFRRPNASGYIAPELQRLPLSDGRLPITSQLLDPGALILEDHQCDSVSLLDDYHHPYLTLTSDAELFGLWSPEHKNAPFVCIEPWMGRADEEGYNGDFTHRVAINHLPIGKEFQFDYSIIVHN